MDLSATEIERNLQEYVEGRSDAARYASFDYCFNYFRRLRDAGHLSEILEPEKLQVSCLHLGFYLASWGMFRGKSHLLQGSMRHYVSLLEVIVQEDALFDVDVDGYDSDAISLLRRGFSSVRQAFPHPATDTLVTKVMLGVFGCVPAFDTYFKTGFRAATFGPKSLRRIKSFYDANEELIERYRIPTLDFSNGRDTDLRYTAAKVIDMVFFVEGMKRGLTV